MSQSACRARREEPRSKKSRARGTPLNVPLITRLPQRGLLRLFGHVEKCGEHLVRRLLFQAIGAQPGLVAAQLVLAGRGQVAVVAVRDGDEPGGLEGAALLEVQA